MAKKKQITTYTFINPNSPKEFENILKKIVIEKLLSLNIQKPQAQPVLS